MNVLTVAVVGLYRGEQGIERMEIVDDPAAARLVMERWKAQRYDGVIEAWQTKPHGAAQRVYPAEAQP